MLPQLTEVFGPQVLRVLVAVAVLFVGWLVARIIAWGVRKALESTTLDNRIATWVLGEEKGGQFVSQVRLAWCRRREDST